MDRKAFAERLADILDISEIDEAFELNWDSMSVLATISLIDEEFGVTVPSKKLTSCTSVGSLLDLVQRSLEQASSQA